MSNNSNSSNGGIVFVGLLTIVFITLKLCEVINWSWWFVLSPIWVPIIIAIPIALALLAFNWYTYYH